MGKFEDLTGQKFNMLTVISRGENTKDNKARWWCKCDCGNPELKLVYARYLKNGKTKSCGCLFTKMLHNRKKYNEYDLSNKYGVGYTSNLSLDGKNEFYFDLEDYDKIKNYCWCFDDDGYLRTTIIDEDGVSRQLLIHRVILPTEDGYMPDHIHGKYSRNDNRKSNLRIVTKSQNAMNQDIRSDNTSGVKGVYWSRKANKWVADIQKNGKRYYLGIFENFDDAVKIRKEAEKKYFGEFSYDTSQAM